MENLTELLEKLAEKLGTTTEYLWGVLIKQAPVSAASDLLYLILVALGGLVLYKIHKKLFKEGDNNNSSIYCKLEGLAIIPMALVSIVWAIIFITCFFSIDNIITGFLNPEYWALDEVMSLIK